VTRRSLDELGVEPGSTVEASFKATAVHLIPRR
jgi:molybdopterin-binding protein